MDLLSEGSKLINTVAELSPQDLPNQPRNVCSRCGKEAASYCQACSGAIDEDGAVLRIWYCGRACQKEDWAIHKPLCQRLKLRKQGYRAAHLAQTIFYHYRETMFDVLITKAEKKGEDLVLWEGNYGSRQLLAPFPNALFTSKEDKEAALTYLTCSDTLDHFHLLTRHLLEGICTDIKEVRIDSKPPKRKIALITILGVPGELCHTAYTHELLCITLKTGEMYAWDIASAQHGYPDPIVPWARFVEQRVLKFTRWSEFGRARRDSWEVKIKGFWRDSIAKVHLLHKLACARLHASVQSELMLRGTTMNDVLMLDGERFKAVKSSLVQLVDRESKKVRTMVEALGGPERTIFHLYMAQQKEEAPDKYPSLPTRVIPTPKKVREWWDSIETGYFLDGSLNWQWK